MEKKELERRTLEFALRNLSEKEAAETEYWLELVDNAAIGDASERAALMSEARELVAIFTRIGRTSKANLKKHRANSQFEIRNSKS